MTLLRVHIHPVSLTDNARNILKVRKIQGTIAQFPGEDQYQLVIYPPEKEPVALAYPEGINAKEVWDHLVNALQFPEVHIEHFTL